MIRPARTPLIAAAITLWALCATSGFAQTIPGDSPNTGIGAAVANSRARPLLGITGHRVPGGTDSSSSDDTRPAPRKALKPRDPWAGVRQASPPDRHGVY